MTKVKICGITNIDDARLAIGFGADELGLNFYRGSSRYVTPTDAYEIISDLPLNVLKIGVFVNEPIESLIKIADYVGLDGIQLHGDEEINYVAELKKSTDKPVIKAFRVTPTFDIGTVLDWHSDFQLFDSYSPDKYGGTGERFPQAAFLFHIYLWLPSSAYVAGGLTPENVAEVIAEACPYAVDVASGVESAPGKKDPAKLEAFIRNAKSA